MTKIIESEQTIELMVNCKTYPAVSQKYIETVCTGGVQASGDFVRLYPVPFRFLNEEERYGRWDVIRARVYKDTKDSRPESWHFQQGTKIEIIEKITTEKRRWEWMKRTVHESTVAMEQVGCTNGCVEIEPLELYWKADNNQLTESQMNVVRQKNLFISDDDLKILADRLPWQFRLKFREVTTGREDDCKVLAWSFYQGLRRRMQQMNETEALCATAEFVRSSIFNPDKTLFGIFGTHSRFGHWMISALYHVPTKIIAAEVKQGGLF